MNAYWQKRKKKHAIQLAHVCECVCKINIHVISAHLHRHAHHYSCVYLYIG